jgi:hypothetical protein
MAKRGTSKALSVLHENKVAKDYNGKRSPSSGGADNDSGDVRTPKDLFECKMTGGPERTNRKPKLLQTLEKITEEAFSEGRRPVLALRFFDTESILSDSDGWIDLIVRPLGDDAQFSAELAGLDGIIWDLEAQVQDLEYELDRQDDEAKKFIQTLESKIDEIENEVREVYRWR